MSTLVRIDAEMMHMHRTLSTTDECYFLWQYTAYANYHYSFGNELIKNLKKSPHKKHLPEWSWKERTIRKIARQLATALPDIIDLSATTIVPIPPSRCRTNPLYDDRLIRILQLACPADADIRELLVNKEDLNTAHTSEEDCRPSVQAIFDNYTWPDAAEATSLAEAPATAIPDAEKPPEPILPIHPTIVLFDDVLTGGNHFVAGRRFIEQRYPQRKIIGIFICRRVTEEVILTL